MLAIEIPGFKAVINALNIINSSFVTRSDYQIIICGAFLYVYPYLSGSKHIHYLIQMNKQTSINSSYALVTGGSSGLGRSIAYMLAQRGYNIILVAMEDDILYETGNEIQSDTGVDVKPIGCDLNNPDSTNLILDRVKSWDVNLSVLINNIGLGDSSYFHANTLNFNRKVVRLNCSIMVELTQLLLPELKKNDEAFILNISSLAGLFPVPYKAVYSASKHFVKAFSYSLREELEEENISVTVVFPGSILTNPNVVRRVQSFGTLARLGVYKAEEVASISLRALFKKKRSVSPGLVNKLYIYIRHMLGYDLTMKLVKNKFKREAIWDLEDKTKKDSESVSLYAD